MEAVAAVAEQSPNTGMAEVEAAAPVAAVPELLPTEPEAIFVVGIGRSGTTMMRTLLETSDRIAIARENHYMGHYFKRRGTRHFFRQAGDLADDATIRRIVEMLYSGEYKRHSRWRNISPYWRWLLDAVPRDEVERALLAAERTERGIFTAFLRIYADREGKPIMGEKTPTHFDHVDELLEWYRNGRLIHILRDPRAVYVSDRHRRRTQGRPPYSWLAKVPLLLEGWILLITVFAWRRAMSRHVGYARRHPARYTLIRFEDVLRKPDEVLPVLSAFLGVEIPLQTERVRVPKEHGMRSSEEGLDPAAADRWRQRIHPLAKRILELGLRGPMRRYGYTD
ncbi:hypothetical protein BH23CHL7_BH23CHL7_12380 [soil metagenome]